MCIMCNAQPVIPLPVSYIKYVGGYTLTSRGLSQTSFQYSLIISDKRGRDLG